MIHCCICKKDLPGSGDSGRRHKCPDCVVRHSEYKPVRKKRWVPPQRPATICRHCHARKVNRPLGLCWSCYYTHGVRELYPSTSKYNSRKSEEDREVKAGKKRPRKPTEAPPGSAEKILILEGRVERKEALWHPGDAGMTEAPVRCFSLLGK